MELFKHFAADRPSLDEALSSDAALFAGAMRDGFRPGDQRIPCVVGADVAENALSYGKRVGLFDSTVSDNLEDPSARLSAEDAALLSRTTLVLATGAFSYITATTLEKLFECWSAAPPVLVFFPLVATRMETLVTFLEQKGMQVVVGAARKGNDQHWRGSAPSGGPSHLTVAKPLLMCVCDGR